MNHFTRKPQFLYLLTGIFFIIDRFFKFIAPNTTIFGFTNFGFEYFENTGIAFGLPVPQTMTLLLTPIILILLLSHIHSSASPYRWVGWWMVFAGALSNFIDRFLFDFVIDYIRIGTAVINIADILVIMGMLLLIFAFRSPPQNE